MCMKTIFRCILISFNEVSWVVQQSLGFHMVTESIVFCQTLSIFNLFIAFIVFFICEKTASDIS